MLGANGSLLLVLSALALGISAIQPSDPFLEVLRVLGGTFLIYLAVTELRTLLGSTVAAPADPPRRLGPTARGIVAVVLNPGAWIFFATTASALLAGASTSGGRDAAMASAIAMALGVSVSDFTFTLIGSGGRHVVGDKGLRWIRIALAGLLGAVGVWFVLEGLWGL
jgi:threonine/homoserine/homoserine lactone efflux protein